MKDSKIQKLFQAAGSTPAPEAPFTFSRDVISAIRRDEKRAQSPALFEQLGALFPRLAWAAVAIISLSVATEFYYSNTADAGTDLSQVAEQWVLAAN